MDALARHNVRVSGSPEAQPMLFAHGFGCDQNMWRFVAPRFEDRYRVILFDHVGAGGSDVSEWSEDRYSSLDGYAQDVVEIADALDLRDTVFVGHSVSAVIGMLASIEAPDRFSKLVLIGPSPRYINDETYVGGFSEEDIHGLLDSLESNYLGWSATVAPMVMGNPDRPHLGAELTESFCRMDPKIANVFARATFLSDNRADLEKIGHRCLVMQCAEDAIAPTEVGEFVHRQLPNSEIVYLRATGHCPNLSAPEETYQAINHFLATA